MKYFPFFRNSDYQKLGTLILKSEIIYGFQRGLKKNKKWPRKYFNEKALHERVQKNVPTRECPRSRMTDHYG